MKKNKLYKIINIIFPILLAYILCSFMATRSFKDSFVNIILSLLIVSFLLVFRNIIDYQKIKNNIRNNAIILITFSVINILIDIFYLKNISMGILFYVLNIFLYLFIVKQTNIKTGIFSLLLMILTIPMQNFISICIYALIVLIIFLCSFINEGNTRRKYIKIIFALIGILSAVCFSIDASSIFILAYVYLNTLTKKIDNNSIKLIIISIITFVVGILIIYPLTSKVIIDSLTININLYNNVLNNDSIMLNIVQISILILLLINCVHMIKIKERSTYAVYNFSILVLILSQFFIKINIYNYLPLFIILISDYLNECDLKQYTNIYRENHIKNRNKKIKKVSVVIPNYNYENYIIERIDSILLQTYPIYELIILDDKSTDNSVKVIEEKIKEIKTKYPNTNIKFMPNEKNSGNVFKQWNKAFEVSTGDYLWIAEADDSCSNIFLQEIMRPFEKNKNVVVSYCESLTMDENNKILMRNLRKWIDIFKTKKWESSFIENGEEYIKDYLSANNTIANVSSLVFKKLDNVDYSKYLKEAEEYKLAGDWYFYEKVLNYGDIAYNHHSYNYHRMHSNSVTLTTKREKEYEEMCHIQDDIIKNHNLSIKSKNNIKQRRDDFQKDFGFSDQEIELDKIDLKKLIKAKKIKDDILLSIIIPVYNTEEYLEKCLNSVMKQIPEKTEVIIVNDGSPDNSEKIIKNFEKKYQDIIKYYKKKNGGLSNTKNFGLDKAKGKYIGFVDSDDYINPTMYEKMLKKAIIEDADMVFCDVEMVYEDGSYRYVSSVNVDIDDKLLSILDTPLMAASWSKITKRELFKDLDYPEGYNNEDIAVSPILFGRSKKICYINSPFYKYLQRTGSIQNSGFNEKRFVAFYTSNLCFERAKKFDKDKQEKIKGSIYTNQLLALLLYPISEIKNKKERIKYIKLFCENMNQFSDYENNKYVIKYMRNLKRENLLSLIRNNNYKKIDKIIKNRLI